MTAQTKQIETEDLDGDELNVAEAMAKGMDPPFGWDAGLGRPQQIDFGSTIGQMLHEDEISVYPPGPLLTRTCGASTGTLREFGQGSQQAIGRVYARVQLGTVELPILDTATA